MENNYVVTIGRQFGSQGKEIAHRLAQRLNVSFYDKELITLASEQSGLCPDFFEKADEQNSGSLLHAFATGFTFGGFQYHDFLSNERLFQIQSEVIRKLAEEESFVVVGRCADYILRDKKRCTNIFIHAPFEVRLKTVMEREHLDEPSALELVRKMDKTRPNYYNYYTEKSWGVASSYHLSLDSSVLGLEESVELLLEFVGRR